jgi:hypothetical protein
MNESTEQLGNSILIVFSFLTEPGCKNSHPCFGWLFVISGFVDLVFPELILRHPNRDLAGNNMPIVNDVGNGKG